MPGCFDKAAIAGIESAFCKDVAVEPGIAIAPYRNVSTVAAAIGIGHDQGIAIDIRVQRGGRVARTMEVAADLNRAAAVIPAGVDKRAGENADMIAQYRDTAAAFAIMVARCIDHAGDQYRRTARFFAFVGSDIARYRVTALSRNHDLAVLHAHALRL